MAELQLTFCNLLTNRHNDIDIGILRKGSNHRTALPRHEIKFELHECKFLIVLGFNDTSTLEGHFVSSPREREKRDKKRE